LEGIHQAADGIFETDGGASNHDLQMSGAFRKGGTTSSHACFNVFNFEYHFFLRECLAGASFSLAEIENGKPGISLAMLSDLVVFFHQALRGNREIAGSKSSHLVMIQAP